MLSPPHLHFLRVPVGGYRGGAVGRERSAALPAGGDRLYAQRGPTRTQSIPGTGSPVKHSRVFWYLVKSDFSSVHVFRSVHWTSHFLKGTRKTLPCFTGHPVELRNFENTTHFFIREISSTIILIKKFKILKILFVKYYFFWVFLVSEEK